MRGELKDTVEDEGSSLVEHISPVPTVVFHDVVRFGFHPQVEGNENEATNPSAQDIRNLSW